MKKYHVTLTDEERIILEDIIRTGKRIAQIIRTAYLLLNVDESSKGGGKSDEEVADFLKITVQTIENIRKKFVLEGFETALYRRPTSRVYNKKIDGNVEAHLIALSCSEPPDGYARWSLRLLSDKMVELNYVDSISHESVRDLLKKRVTSLEGKGLGDTTGQ